MPLVAAHVALAARPARIPVNEPPRVRPSMVPVSRMRPSVVPAVRAANPVRVAGPPMLRPGAIDGVLKSAARDRATGVGATSPAPSPQRAMAPAALVRAGARTPQTLADGTPGTGINPWWRYQEQSVPGGGRVMVNVGSGNLLFQDDDMAVAHKGLAMAFRRTYNSQSGHDVSASDAAGYYAEPPGMYGNGWTNTFDAHVARNADGTLFSVFDIDGARYDFVNGVASPGNHTTLVGDGTCGFLWTKKSGTTYYFYRPTPVGSCPPLGGVVGGYAGRLYQIVGRNRNTYITFSYSWDGGDASATGKIAGITATTESGMSATLAFGDVNGHRLLTQLTYPDGVTAVFYGYDAQGNLTWVSRPENNASGVRPLQTFGYQALGTRSVLEYAASPRYNGGCAGAGGCGSDGGLLTFTFAGSAVESSALSSIWHYAVVNPTIPDGSNATSLQGSGYPSTAYWYLGEYYTTGVPTPTFRDTDGHMTNWVVDASASPTQTQECTWSLSQGQQCIDEAHWLVTNETWDANRNLTAETDARGNQTDYAYDVHGNTVAVAAPPPTTGASRPTRLFSYDEHDNLKAYCDPNATQSIGAAWTAPPTAPVPGPGAGLCPQSTVATQYHWTTSSDEPFGLLDATTSPATPAAPTGYTRTFAYDVGPQGGANYGLPTRVSGASITQTGDPTTPTRTPQQTFWYDANGNLVCYGTGSGQWLLTYDTLGRLTTTADPDDAAGGTGACAKTGAQPGWNTTAHTAYFPNGAVKSKQTASQFANGVATTFAYDLDGNVQTETHQYGCTSTASCTAGVTSKWYDGADRLVEVQQPYDATDIQAYPWSTRYIYDLNAGGTTSYRGMGLPGYGNLVATRELLTGAAWTPAFGQTYGEATGTWMDVRATSFDALDRPVSSYEAALGDQPKTTNTYDAPGGAGLLTSVHLATNETKYLAYDAMGRETNVSYTGDNGVTPPTELHYDAAGNVISRATTVLGTENIAYDATGAPTSVTEPPSLGGGTISYHYYADGLRSSAGYSDALISSPNALQYAYRPDGKRDRLTLPNGTAFAWTYTAAGRLQTQSDPLTGTSVQPDATYANSKGVQTPFYPSSLTYGPWTESFDTYGRVASITFPVSLFTYTSSQYDLEDGVSKHTVSGYQPAGYSRFASQTLCLLSSVRGEKTPLAQMLNGSCVIAGMPNEINGAQLTGSSPAAQLPLALNWTLDARSGMLLHRTAQDTTSTETIGASYAYDSSGRIVQDFEGLFGPRGASPPTFTPTWCTGFTTATRCYTDGSRAKTYDAENRLHSETFTYTQQIVQTSSYPAKYGSYWEDSSGYKQPANIQAVDYGTTSHPMRFALYHPDLAGVPNATPSETRAWLWDGNDRFIACQLVSSQCQNPSLSMEGLGDYDLAHGTLVRINDRNRYGLASMTRTAFGFSGWVDKPNIRSQRALNVPCSTGSVDADPNDPLPACVPQHDGKLTADGWSLDYETWQGVRTFDPAIGQWNTPDAYAGEVHDPMSQKPFMWNRNNPYAYSDPSGYAPWWEELGSAVARLLRRESPFVSSTQKLEKGLTTSTGQLTPLGARVMGTLREIPLSRGNFGIGSVGDVQQAKALGDIWVGQGSRPLSSGLGKVSRDGTKVFRDPVIKSDGSMQANFEALDANGNVIANGHLDIRPGGGINIAPSYIRGGTPPK